MSQVMLAEYGRAKTLSFELYEVDGVDLRVDAADAGADCTRRLDEAASGTCTNDFVDEGSTYSLVLTAAEMQAAKITVKIVDSATKVWLDKVIVIETYGHPSSAHPFMTPFWANGAVNDASASSTVWTFDGFTEATADHVIGSELVFTSGANAGQCRTVTDYTSTVITVAPAFLAAPADNDEFVLRAKPTTSAGQVPAVDIASILTDTGTTLPALLPAALVSGRMDASVDATGLEDGARDKIVDQVWDEAVSGHVAAGSFGKTDADILADTNELQADDIPGKLPSALVSGRMDSDVGAKTGNVALSAQEKLDVNTEGDNVFTTQMADSVPSDGTISTREQGIYAILQMLSEFAISGTTLTVKKVDGSTTLMTFTLDDATTPTSLTRAT